MTSEQLRDRLADWRVVRWFTASHDVYEVKLPPDDAQPSEVSAAVVAHVLSRPDSIRQRAQAAATISGALGIALVVAAVGGLSGGSKSLWHAPGVLVCIAIIFFALSTALSIYAVVFPHDVTGAPKSSAVPLQERSQEQAEASRYQPLVTMYEEYADAVRQKMRWAAAATGIALVTTVAAVAVELFPGTENMDLLLKPEAMSDVARLCKWRAKAPVIRGEMVTGELDQPVVEIKQAITPGVDEACGTVRVPRSSIRAAHRK